MDEQIIYHEAGHILIARACNWTVDDIRRGDNGNWMSVSFRKQVGNTLVRKYFQNPLTEIQKQINEERYLITQGGWAAENFKGYEITDDSIQFTQDNINASNIGETLENVSIELAQSECISILENNGESLELIAEGIRDLLNGVPFDFSDIIIKNEK